MNNNLFQQLLHLSNHRFFIKPIFCRHHILSILAVVEFRKYWDSHIFQCLFDTRHCLYYTELAFISVKQVIGCQRMKLYRIKEKTNRFLCE